jgi:cell division protease FtsH
VLAATNRVDLIDPALPRSDRFDIVLDRALPDTVSRRSIFAVHVRQMPLAHDVDLADLAARTKGCVGADIAGICRLAALARAPEVNDLFVAGPDFAIALGEYQGGQSWRI